MADDRGQCVAALLVAPGYIAPERACKPGSVSRLPGETVISLGRRLPGASSSHTREPHAGRASPALASGIALLFGLAPGGVYRADLVTQAAGELLPHRFTLTAREGGGLLSVALSMGSPPLAVSQHPALRSPDFPPARLPVPAIIQPSLAQSKSVCRCEKV